MTDGRLTLTPQQTSLLGFPLPDGLFSGITATVDSTVASLPEGVVIEDARVVPDGLEVLKVATFDDGKLASLQDALGGKDVALR